MKFGSGALLVAVGLLVLWLAVSGRLSNLSPAWNVLNGAPATGGGSPDATATNQFSSLLSQFPVEAFPPLPIPIPSLN